MLEFQQIKNPKKLDLIVFALGQLVFFAVVLGNRSGLHWRGWAGGVLVVSLFIAVLGIVSPQRIRPLYVFWMAAVFPLGWLTSSLVLALIFYGVVTPVGLLFRALKGDPLHRKQEKSAATYWEPRHGSTQPGSYFRQF